MTISLRRLEAFVTVAETASVLEAAKRLNITGPAVTKAVRQLEQALGVDLFLRLPEGMRLTQYGELYYQRSKAALGEIDRGAEEIRALIGPVEGRVTVGTLPNAGHPILALAAARLMEQRPDLSISIHEGSYATLLNDLATGVIDFMVGVIRAEMDSDDLQTDFLYYDKVMIAAREGHPFGHEADLTPARLADAHWVLPPPQTALRRAIEAGFETVGLAPPANIIEVASWNFVQTILCESDRIAPMTQYRLVEESKVGRLRALPVDVPVPPLPVGVIRRAASPMTPWARAFLNAVRQTTVETATL